MTGKTRTYDIKAYIYAAASYTKERGGCGLLCKSQTMNRKCVQCMIGEIFFIVVQRRSFGEKKDHSADQVTR